MKQFSPIGLQSWLLTHDEFVVAECFTITLISGTVLRYTSAQRDISVIPVGDTITQNFLANKLLLSGLYSQSSFGFSVHEQSLDVTPQAGTTILNQSWQQAMIGGVFDGAIIRKDRYFFSDWSLAASPQGGCIDFIGKMSTASAIGGTTTTIKVKTQNVLLNMNMPRFNYQPGCRHILFDGGCRAVKSSFASSGTVVASPAPTNISFNGSGGVGNATGSFYALGYITFNTGQNIGISRNVNDSGPGTGVVLATPFPFIPAVGDAFTAYAGCDKTTTTCVNKFNNIANFIGYPFVPTAESAY